MGLLIKWLMTICLLASFSTFGQEPEQVTFKKRKIWIKDIPLTVEVAETPDQHQYGLMNRTKLEPKSGMLFVFSDEQIRSFWMKNTYVDLSIGYFDKNQKLFEVLDMKASSLVRKEKPEDLKTYPSRRPAKYALEVPLGWFKKNGIVPNKDSFKFD